MPLANDSNPWLRKRSCGRVWLVASTSRKLAMPISRIESSICAAAVRGLKLSALAAMPITSPSRITAYSGRS